MITLLTNAFAPFRVFKRTIEQVHSTATTKFVHLVLNQHYPINKSENWELIKNFCASKNIECFDAGKNLGLAGGYNYLIKQANVKDEDVIILIDPDVWPVTVGWDAAIATVLKDRSVGWASLNHDNHHPELGPHSFCTINGIRLLVAHAVCVNAICGTPGHFLNKLDQGLQEPKYYYGHLEKVLFNQLSSLGYNWVFLTDFIETENKYPSDVTLAIYKWAYAHENSTDLSFEDWRNGYLSGNNFYRNIHGWFNYQGLYEEVVRMTKNNPAHFVEVGAWLGSGSCFMATEIKLKNKNIKFDVIDSWSDDINPKNWGSEDVVTKYGSFFEAFKAYMMEGGVNEYVNPIRIDSLNGSKLYPNNSLDFVFINSYQGDHTYEACKNDILAWLPKLKKPSGSNDLPIIAGHAYDWEGVAKAVNEIFGSKFTLSNNCWRVAL